MIVVYGYMPAWDLPDISPFVTKLVNYLTFAGIKFEYRGQDLTRLDQDTPHGKLPYIVDGDKKIADSNTIISYLKKEYGDHLDADLTKEQLAQSLAFNRLIEEHLYWSGVIEPRWRSDSGWETYIPYIVQGAEVTPDLRAFLDAFRNRIVTCFNGQGMGRRSTEVVHEIYKVDVDALSDYLGDKPYFFGDKIHAIDASVYAFVRHLADQPHKWIGTGYIQGKQNLMAYIDRIRKEYKV